MILSTRETGDQEKGLNWDLSGQRRLMHRHRRIPQRHRSSQMRNHRTVQSPDERSPDEIYLALRRRVHRATARRATGRAAPETASCPRQPMIKNLYQPNALLTFKEYLIGYGSDKLKEVGEAVIAKEVEEIPSDR